MPTPPPGPRAKIRRAEKHLADLRSEIAAHSEANPYTVVCERHPERGLLYRVKPWPPPIPESVPLIFGDLVHNLRSGLDIMICDLVRNHRPEDLGDWTGFPVVTHAKSLPSQVGSKVKGSRNAVQKAVMGHKPYKGGNPSLWQLHRLNILDKHRLILTTVLANESVNIGKMLTGTMRRLIATEPDADEWGDMPDMDLWLRPARPCDDEGGVVFGAGVDAEPQDDMEFRLHVALHEPGLVECEPLIPFATQLLRFVEGLVHSFDPLFT